MSNPSPAEVLADVLHEEVRDLGPWETRKASRAIASLVLAALTAHPHAAVVAAAIQPLPDERHPYTCAVCRNAGIRDYRSEFDTSMGWAFHMIREHPGVEP